MQHAAAAAAGSGRSDAVVLRTGTARGISTGPHGPGAHADDICLHSMLDPTIDHNVYSAIQFLNCLCAIP